MVSHGPALTRNAQELLSEFVASGRQEPFEEIVRRYAGMVFNVCLQILKDTHDAEDATQAVFLTLAVQAKTANGVKYIGPWLQRVAQRLSLDIKRSKTRRKAREERHSALTIARNGENVPDHGQTMDLEELKGMLRDELDKLPAKYRLPLILHYFGGLKPEDMARELGCKPSTLGVRLHRGRKMLAESLADRGVLVNGSVLGVALAAMIRSTVTQHLIHSTSHAAVQMVAGYSAGAEVSAQVLSFNRMAASGVTLARLKAAITAGILIAGAVAGAAQIVTKTHILDGHFGFGGELRSWLAPLFRAFTRPLRAGADSAAPKVDVMLANDLVVMPDRSLSIDPWLRPAPSQPNLGNDLLFAPASTTSAMTISLAPSAPTASTPAIAPAFTLPAPRNDSSARLPTSAQALSISAAAQLAPSNVSFVAPSPQQYTVDSPTYGANAGESVFFDFNRSVTTNVRKMTVADHGSAAIHQSAGTINVAESLALGKSSDGNGTYIVGGTARLHATNITAGDAGAGHLVQNDQAIVRADTITLGRDGKGTLDINGGSLQARAIDVAVRGTGQLNQTGGDAKAHGIHVAVASGSNGSVSLSNGTFAAQDQVVGNVGNGAFVQDGGRNKTSSLKIGSAGQGVGSYTLNAGTIELQKADGTSAPPAQIVVGSNAKGTFQLGDEHNTGAITEADDGAAGSLVVRAKPSARGTFTGWGEVHLSGSVTDNGKVVADGFGQDRTLDLSRLARVTNTIDNPPEGTNGWFARNCGKLQLPALHVQAGTGSYIWGENPYDGQPDLINSVRLTLHDIASPGDVDIALAASDRADLPQPPDGFKLLSIWQTNLADLHASAMDLLVRYDQTGVKQNGADESAVQLWMYTDHWQPAPADSTFVDGEQHLLYASNLSPASLFAIATPQISAIGVPTPEPGITLVLTGLAGALLARRRAR